MPLIRISYSTDFSFAKRGRNISATSVWYPAIARFTNKIPGCGHCPFRRFGPLVEQPRLTLIGCRRACHTNEVNRVVACGHSFCFDCVNRELAISRGRLSHRQQLRFSHNDFMCPICNVAVENIGALLFYILFLFDVSHADIAISF